jgi:hypothetical protein
MYTSWYSIPFVYGVICRVYWNSALAMAAQVNRNDREIVLQASDLARGMPLMAPAASAMQQHDRWPCAAAIIGNPHAIG